MKNCIRPNYEKLKLLKSGFIENSNFENNRDPCFQSYPGWIDKDTLSLDLDKLAEVCKTCTSFKQQDNYVFGGVGFDRFSLFTGVCPLDVYENNSKGGVGHVEQGHRRQCGR